MSAQEEASFCEVPTVHERRIAFAPLPRRVKVIFNGITIAESERAILVREENVVPVYYVPFADIDQQYLVKTERSSICNIKGVASYWHILADGQLADNAVWAYENPIPNSAELRGYASFYLRKVEMYEEEERVVGHPKDPFVRVDALRSSRHIKVEISGEVVAESSRPVIVYETGMAPRYYLPSEDVRSDTLKATGQLTYSPYYGTAEILSAVWAGGRKDKVAWTYADPVPELAELKDYIAFYQEKVDAFYINEMRWEPREGELLYLKGI